MSLDTPPLITLCMLNNLWLSVMSPSATKRRLIDENDIFVGIRLSI